MPRLPVAIVDQHPADLELWDEAWAKRIADRQPAAWQYQNGTPSTVVTGDDPPPKRIGPDDPAHNSARDLIEHVIADRVTKPARDAVRKALDAADAPAQGKLASGAHRAPEGLGRALGRAFASVGLRIP